MRKAVLRLAVVLAVAPVLVSTEDADAFTFKRLSVTDITPGKRITVQIDPEAQALLLAARPWKERESLRGEPAAPLEPVAPAGGSYGWYWDSVPVGRDATGDRFELALAALDNGPEGASVVAPRLQGMQDLAQAWGHRHLARNDRDRCVAGVGAGGDRH